MGGGGSLGWRGAPACVTPGPCPRLRKRLSVSESSHTESDSSPPLTVRRHCSGLLDAPRFPEATEEARGAPRRQQPEGAWPPTPPSGEGGSGLAPDRPAERRLALDEEPGGPSSASGPGVARQAAGGPGGGSRRGAGRGGSAAL